MSTDLITTLRHAQAAHFQAPDNSYLRKEWLKAEVAAGLAYDKAVTAEAVAKVAHVAAGDNDPDGVPKDAFELAEAGRVAATIPVVKEIAVLGAANGQPLMSTEAADEFGNSIRGTTLARHGGHMPRVSAVKMQVCFPEALFVTTRDKLYIPAGYILTDYLNNVATTSKIDISLDPPVTELSRDQFQDALENFELLHTLAGMPAVSIKAYQKHFIKVFRPPFLLSLLPYRSSIGRLCCVGYLGVNAWILVCCYMRIRAVICGYLQLLRSCFPPFFCGTQIWAFLFSPFSLKKTPLLKPISAKNPPFRLFTLSTSTNQAKFLLKFYPFLSIHTKNPSSLIVRLLMVCFVVMLSGGLVFLSGT